MRSALTYPLPRAQSADACEVVDRPGERRASDPCGESPMVPAEQLADLLRRTSIIRCVSEGCQHLSQNPVGRHRVVRGCRLALHRVRDIPGIRADGVEGFADLRLKGWADLADVVQPRPEHDHRTQLTGFNTDLP